MEHFKYRLDLEENELKLLQKILEIVDIDDLEESTTFLSSLVNNPKKIRYSHKKYGATVKATEVRTNNAKDKIKSAIAILKKQNKSITYYSISKVGAVSYQTVKKYISLNEIKE